MVPVPAASLRGVVLGQGMARVPTGRPKRRESCCPDCAWSGREPVSSPAELELLGEAGGWWVGKRR